MVGDLSPHHGSFARSLTPTPIAEANALYRGQATFPLRVAADPSRAEVQASSGTLRGASEQDAGYELYSGPS
ncbi:hypothetical protein Acsp07_13250 [Actinomycetospora sp. NBRC 106378]|nr:hypothetical protein Acsp07_13250 [Actinomycetospora sp. NBRC 106378]